jgi:two-component system OmpR family response regulator
MYKKILIIDDDNDFILLVTEILTKKNHQVFFASTIAEGLVLLDKNVPDVVFLDNQLPDGSGWSKTEFILEKYPNIQLNLMSGLDVPKTTTTSFRILEKQQMLEELLNNY